MMRHDLLIWLLLLSALYLTVCISQPALAGPQVGCSRPKLGGMENTFAGCKPAAAFNRVKELANQGDPKALYILGRFYELGGKTFGLPKISENPDLAQKYYLESARKGYADAQAEVGWFYGRYFPDTMKQQSLFWFCKAAEQHSEMAIVNLQNEIAYRQINKTWQQFCNPILGKGGPK